MKFLQSQGIVIIDFSEASNSVKISLSVSSLPAYWGMWMNFFSAEFKSSSEKYFSLKRIVTTL